MPATSQESSIDQLELQELLADPTTAASVKAMVTGWLRDEGASEVADEVELHTLLDDPRVAVRLNELLLPVLPCTVDECERRRWPLKAFEKCCCSMRCMARRANVGPEQLDGWAARVAVLDEQTEVQAHPPY